ncbi:hypothetical protein [Geodermatophilus sp. DSM 45219]|uniref:hypothetical protein n=1 Tax=Geodermatophilus sp. DSM 45219 TaxID=1881103 RepID=UPI00115FEAB3|nr:hypothetical protein [Geodermatophilus sp. DSM 45219]
MSTNPLQPNIDVQKIAGRIARLERQQKANRTPQLGNSSLDNAALNVRDAAGQLTAIVGVQYDGTSGAVSVSGPTPPTPSGVTLEDAIGGVLLRWDGTFEGGLSVVAPQDWSRAEVHASPDINMAAMDASALVSTIESPRGGSVFIPSPPGVAMYARLVARSQSGKRSGASVVAGPAEAAEVGNGTKIHQGATEPENPAIGDLWYATVGTSNGQPTYEARRYFGPADGGWKPLRDQAAVQALAEVVEAGNKATQAGVDALAAKALAEQAQDGLTSVQTEVLLAEVAASSAQQVAQQAQNQAADAIADAADAKATADGKVTTYFTTWAGRPVAPAMKATDDGDLLFASDQGNKLYRWNGSTLAWVVAADQTAADALTAAQNAATAAGNAQTTANSKIVTLYSTTEPSHSNRTEGDLWVDQANGNRLNRWSVAANDFVPVQLGAGAISATARDLGSINIYRQASEPASNVSRTNDLWVRSTDNRVHVYNGTTWVESKDEAINTVATDAATAQATADQKVRVDVGTVFPTGRVPADVGDVFIKTDEGNATYTWAYGEAVAGTPYVPATPEQPYIPPRTNLCLNPSFEIDPVGAIATNNNTPTHWGLLESGAGLTTRTIVNGTTGVIDGTKAAKIVSPSLGTSSTARIGFTQTITGLAVGDVIRASAHLQVTVTDGNHPVEIRAEFLDSLNSVVGTAVTTQGLDAAGDQFLKLTTGRLPAGVDRVRVQVYRRGNDTGAVLSNADLYVDSVLIEKNVPASAPDTFILSSDPGQPYAPAQPEQPATPSLPEGWRWVKRAIGGGAIQPKSLVARDVIATGTVSAALFEALMVLTTTVIAGNPHGDHARLTPQGFFAYTADEIDGIPNVAIRLGTGTDDYLGITNQYGQLVTTLDETGAVNARTANFQEDITISGRSIEQRINEVGGGRIVGRYRGTLGANLEPIRPEIGIVEANAYLSNTRFYDIKWRLSWRTNQMPSDVTFRIRSTVGIDSNTADAPTINSYAEEAWTKAQTSPNYQHTDEGSVRISPAFNGRHRFLLTMAVGDPNGTGTTTGSVMGARQIDLSIVDAGPRGLSDGGLISRGGGILYGGTATPAAPPPVQNHFVELAPAGWKSWNANNTLRGSTDQGRNGINGPIQGIAPGTSGSQKGHWWFAIPAITGTITRMEFYVWADHWYLNSGGTGVFNVAWFGQGGPNYPKHKGDHLINGIPKPGGTNWVLPSDWWEHYTTHPPGGLKADGITVGPTGNYAHEYGRYNGDSARLKIWFTQ